MPVGVEGEKNQVLVSYTTGRGKPCLTVTVWISREGWSNREHLAFQAFLLSVKRLQDAIRGTTRH